MTTWMVGTVASTLWHVADSRLPLYQIVDEWQFIIIIIIILLPPPKKEVMFLVRSVCLSVRRITCKLVNGF